MKASSTLFLAAVVALSGHTMAADISGAKTKPIISLSAKGWSIKPGTPARGAPDGRPTTIVVNPSGDELNIGETQYPDFLAATLWIVEVKELNARFLIIRVPPVASAGVKMPILYISEDNQPRLAGQILQRFEFEANPDDAPGFNPTVRWDGTHPLRDLLFEDSDSDGVPELVEKDLWKEGGTVTYSKFTAEKSFVPLWKEEWRLRAGDATALERVSRTKVENAKR